MLGWAFLGLGDLDSRGDEPGEMGDALPPVDLGTGRTARSVSIGWSHTCAVLDDATTKCWGDNREGILGLGDVAPRGSQPGQMGDALPAVDLGTGFTPSSVAAGQYFSCGVSTDGRVKCWGQNIDGVLGTADATYHGESPDSMGDGLPAVDLGAGVTATAVTAGAAHACALLADGGVKCWGRNFGTLGVGDEQARGDDARLMGDHLPRVALTGPTHGPDLSVRVRGGNLQGEGRFGADYPCGCVVAGGRPGGRVEFVVRLRNAGSVPDRFRLAGELWWSGHSYRILPRGQWPDVSGPVLAGAYLTEALDPGEWTTVRLFTTVPTTARADPYRYRNLTLAAASETAGNRDWIHTSVRLG